LAPLSYLLIINVLWTVRFFVQDGEPVEPFPKFPVTPFTVSPDNSDIMGPMANPILRVFGPHILCRERGFLP
jgi:hypothetical protein